MHLGNIADPFMPGAVVLRNEKVLANRDRPGVNAAVRGCDWRHPIDSDGPPNEATIKQAPYLRHIYTEVLAMEERLVPIRQLMLKQSDEGRREVELTNAPVVAAQAERFRQLLGHWEAWVAELGGESRVKP